MIPVAAVVKENLWRKEVLPAPSYDNVEVVLEPYNYLLQIPGKEIRTKLILAFNHWLGVAPNVVTEISGIVQMLHTASLLIDDIEDNSKLRRGIPTAHLVYGVPWAINCGNYVYFKAMERCTQLGSANATHHFLQEMIRLHHGQGFEIYWRDSNICPTEEEYIRMVKDKTGGLFRLAILLMETFSTNPHVSTEKLLNLASNLALYFQIRDDYINLSSAEYAAKKGFCEDLTEGKFSFPIIHCITVNSTDRRLLSILKQRTEDPDIKKYAVELMRISGSFDYTKSRLDEIMIEIRAQLAEFENNPLLEPILTALAQIDSDKQLTVTPSLRLSQEVNANQ